MASVTNRPTNRQTDKTDMMCVGARKNMEISTRTDSFSPWDIFFGDPNLLMPQLERVHLNHFVCTSLRLFLALKRFNTHKKQKYCEEKKKLGGKKMGVKKLYANGKLINKYIRLYFFLSWKIDSLVTLPLYVCFGVFLLFLIFFFVTILEIFQQAMTS